MRRASWPRRARLAVEAIHPGYGFLAENAAFAAACTAAGFTFVGPPAQSIAAMGSKILAKRRMGAAGVPLLPGYAGEEQDLEHLGRAARAAGLPLIVKPAAGGGGKGMQIVRREAQIAPALAAARRLAESAFGDGALLLERYLEAPRHIEVQVFADRHGNCVHLGERDCSIQRRHQKLIEEAPAPQLPPEVRARLRAAALVVARAVDYVGAGTVEFLYDAGEFYFMEMNTRLQVEHTVTEAITGLDLVEWQLRVAAGEALPLKQEEIRFSGHAIEARVCAEDPQRGFLPSAGELALLEWPEAAHVRVDAGFVSGDRVPETYDSLLGKVIAWAETREVAAARLAAALDATYCVGVHSNEHWLARVLRDERFLGMRHSIAFLDAAGGQFAPAPLQPAALVLAALAQLLPAEPARGDPSPWAQTDGFTPNLPAEVTVRFSADAHAHRVELQFQDGRPASARVDGGTVMSLHEVSRRGTHLAARLGAQHVQARLFSAAARVHLWTPTEHVELALDDPRAQQFEASAATGGLTTPLAGRRGQRAREGGRCGGGGGGGDADRGDEDGARHHRTARRCGHRHPLRRRGAGDRGQPAARDCAARLRRLRGSYFFGCAALASARALAISLSVLARSAVNVSPRAMYLPATAMVGMPVTW